MVARKKPAKQNSNTAPIRELFSDSISHAETQTTSPTAAATENEKPIYLRQRPVKFINVRIGAKFILNGGTWEKIDSSKATHLIPVRDRDIPVRGATLAFAPGDFVFLQEEAPQS